MYEILYFAAKSCIDYRIQNSNYKSKIDPYTFFIYIFAKI